MASCTGKVNFSSSGKEKGIGLESVLENAFDELISEFKKKFLHKIIKVLEEAKYNENLDIMNERRKNFFLKKYENDRS